MNILFVQKVKALVGSEKYFLELLPELEKRGHSTAFICIYTAEDEEKTLPFITAFKERNLTIHVLKIKSDKAIFKCTRFIKKIIKKGQFDLVHSHLIHADFWCALLKATHQIKIPLVSTKHGYDEQYIAQHGFSAAHLTPNLYLRLCRFSEKYIDRSFAVSEGLRQLFIDAKIADSSRIEIIHHGFDLPKLTSSPKGDYRFSPHQIVVLGRIIPFKGHRFIVEAIPLIKKEIPEIQLVVVGHGDSELITEIETYCDQNNIKNNVQLVGYQSNIYDYLLDADIMVVPSVSEGFGLIFLEALNAKIPIVGFNVPATSEILQNQKTGILVTPYRVPELAQNIIDLLKNPKKAKQLANAGHDRLNTYFTLDRMTTATLDFYQKVIS